MLGGIITKFAFIALLSFESVLMGAMNEHEMTERRRHFLRYVFHEVRVPLNTITMGICLLSAEADALKEHHRDVVGMMDGAAIFMGQTLNDVLSMSNIEGVPPPHFHCLFALHVPLTRIIVSSLHDWK